MMVDVFFQQQKLLMLALDHRGSLERMIPNATDDKYETIVSIKRMLMTVLSPYYSGILLDSDYGLPAYTASGIKKPYVLCIEKTGYTDTNHERLTQIEYSVQELKDKGASGVKLLLFFHPDAKTAKDQITLTRTIFEACQANNLPFFLEILNYSLDNKPYDPTILVPKSVEIFLDHGITADVFKLEFPGDSASCKKITRLLEKIPWILLTKGASYENFKEGLIVASQNGARGFLAGRSIWQDFTALPQDEWEQFIRTTVKDRFEQICSIAQKNRN